MAVNLSAIKDLLLPGLRGLEGKYEQIPSQYDKIFTKHNSKMALERTAEMRFLGLAQLKTEGGQTSFDNGAGRPFRDPTRPAYDNPAAWADHNAAE